MLVIGYSPEERGEPVVDESAHNKGALGSLYAGTGQDLADDAVEVVGVARDDAGEEVPGAAEPADLDDFGDFFHRLGNLCQLPLGDLDIYEGAQWVAQGGWVYSVVESHKVSSIVEAGQPPFPVSAWFALVGPAGLSPQIVATMNKAMAAALAKPSVSEAMQRQGFIPKSSTPEYLATYMKDQIGVWNTALKVAGIEPQ